MLWLFLVRQLNLFPLAKIRLSEGKTKGLANIFSWQVAATDKHIASYALRSSWH